MAKRIYFETVKKWAIKSGIVGGTLVGLLFVYLFAIGSISNVSYSGDSICEGTQLDPCYAFINFTAEEDIFIYPTGYDPWGRDTLFSFDPAVKSWKLERSWGTSWREIKLDETCQFTWCGAPYNNMKDNKYSIAFREGRDYKLRITGYKNNPYETIKWGAFSGVDEIDPVWLSLQSNRTLKENLMDKDYKNYIRNTNTLREKKGNYYKSYNYTEKEILIENLNNEIELKLKLESDYEVVVLGWNDMDLIAWFNLSDFKGKNFVDGVKFYDVNNNYEEIEKNYTFKYKTKENISVCDEFENKCEIFEDDVWVEFDFLSDLPSKNIEIGLFIDIVSGDKIEWVMEKDGFEILEWALVIGTNSGFVTVAPTSNPGVGGDGIADEAAVTRDTSPLNAQKITEIGWYLDSSDSDANFEVGLYADDGAVVPGEAGTLLEVSRTNAKGTTTGWKRVSVDWIISENTTYWLALQIDGSGFNILPRINFGGGFGKDQVTAKTTLTDPLGGGALDDVEGAYAIYALVQFPDAESPTYSDVSDNNSLAGKSTKFSVLWDDDVSLNPNGQYIFSTNNSGTWVNDSTVNFTSTPSWANVTKTLNSTEGLSIGYRWFATDDVANFSATDIFILTIATLELQITSPTSSSPLSVSEDDNISINFNFQNDGVNITSDVNMNNVTIGGINANIVQFDSGGTGISLVGDASDNTDNVNSVAVDVSGIGIQDDDLILFFGSADGIGFALPSGFTQLQDTATAASHANILAYKVASSEGSSYTVNTKSSINERGIAIFTVYRGVDIADPIDQSNSNIGGSDQTGVITSITPTNDDSAVVVFIGTEDGNAGNPFVTSWASPLVEQLDNVNGPPGSGAASSAGAYADVIQTTKTAVSGNIVLGGAGGNTNWGTMAVSLNALPSGLVQEFGFISGVGWQVNVTAPNGTGLEDLFLNATYLGSTKNDTQTNAINYGGVGDTCTYTSGNWDVTCSDNCSITSNVDLGGNNLTLSNDNGNFDVRADISNYDKIIKYDLCEVRIYSSGFM